MNKDYTVMGFVVIWHSKRDPKDRYIVCYDHEEAVRVAQGIMSSPKDQTVSVAMCQIQLAGSKEIRQANAEQEDS